MIRGEDPDEFEAVRRNLELGLSTKGFQESEQVEKIAIELWKLRRLKTIETEFLLFEQAEINLELAEQLMDEYAGKLDHRCDGIVMARINEQNSASRENDSEVDDSGETQENINKEEKRKEVIERYYDALKEIEISSSRIVCVFPVNYLDVLEIIPRYEKLINRSLTQAQDSLWHLQRTRQKFATSLSY